MTAIIKEKWYKIKRKIYSKLKIFWKFIISDTGFFILILILSMNLSFFLGKLSVIYKTNNQKQEEVIIKTKETKTQNIEVIGSKKGSVYHYPWCMGASHIKKTNIVKFKNKEAAEKAGRRLAKNCEEIE